MSTYQVLKDGISAVGFGTAVGILLLLLFLVYQIALRCKCSTFCCSAWSNLFYKSKSKERAMQQSLCSISQQKEVDESFSSLGSDVEAVQSNVSLPPVYCCPVFSSDSGIVFSPDSRESTQISDQCSSFLSSDSSAIANLRARIEETNMEFVYATDHDSGCISPDIDKTQNPCVPDRYNIIYGSHTVEFSARGGLQLASNEGQLDGLHSPETCATFPADMSKFRCDNAAAQLQDIHLSSLHSSVSSSNVPGV